MAQKPNINFSEHHNLCLKQLSRADDAVELPQPVNSMAPKILKRSKKAENDQTVEKTERQISKK